MRISDYTTWKIPRQVGAQDKSIQLPQSKMVWDIMHLLKLVGCKVVSVLSYGTRS